MKEVFSMWKYTKMVVLVALCSALYAACLIPFKAISIIPGALEIRPAQILPPVMGLLFGPAGAWGSGIGNFIADLLGGTLVIGSLVGIVANFFIAYIAYKLWHRLGLVKPSEDSLKINNAKKVINFALISILGAMVCALIIGLWGDLAKLAPMSAIGSYIAVTNSIPPLILGVPLMIAIYPRVKKWGLLWTDIMEEDLPEHTVKSQIGAVIMVIGIVVGLVGGIVAGVVFVNQGIMVGGFGKGEMGSAIVNIISGGGVLLTFIGSLLQK
jgi:energy-coupling factor transport system substrate-specific component